MIKQHFLVVVCLYFGVFKVSVRPRSSFPDLIYHFFQTYQAKLPERNSHTSPCIFVCMEKSFDILIMAPFAIQKKVIGISNDMRVDDDRRNCK